VQDELPAGEEPPAEADQGDPDHDRGPREVLLHRHRQRADHCAEQPEHHDEPGGERTRDRERPGNRAEAGLVLLTDERSQVRG